MKHKHQCNAPATIKPLDRFMIPPERCFMCGIEMNYTNESNKEFFSCFDCQVSILITKPDRLKMYGCSRISCGFSFYTVKEVFDHIDKDCNRIYAEYMQDVKERLRR